MSTEVLIIVAGALFGIGVYGALSQQSFVMLMMGLEMMVNGAILAVGVFWARTAGGNPQGQMLAIVFLTSSSITTTSALTRELREWCRQTASSRQQTHFGRPWRPR